MPGGPGEVARRNINEAGEPGIAFGPEYDVQLQGVL